MADKTFKIVYSLLASFAIGLITTLLIKGRMSTVNLIIEALWATPFALLGMVVTGFFKRRSRG